MPKPGSTFAGFPLTEEMEQQNGYSWRVCTLTYAQGVVIAESDFASQQKVNRIRVETPELKVRGGLHVGQTLADMLGKTSKWKARPFPAYQLIEMTSTKYPRMVFLLEEKGFDYSQIMEAIALEKLSSTAKLVGIVVL